MPTPLKSTRVLRNSRRNFLRGSAAAIGLALAGCGSSERSTTAPAGTTASATTPRSTQAPSTTASASTIYPVTVEHRYGATTIESEPRRVFAAGLTDIDPILALGVMPVGFIDWYGDYPKADIRNGLWPWAHDLGAGAGITVLPRNNDEFNFEAIAALSPDLIIAQYSGMTEQDYQTATAIAPVVAQSADHPLYETPWDVTTRRIGLALGRSDQAAALIAGVKAEFAAARAAHPEFAGKTAVLVDYYQDIIYARGPAEPHGKVLAQLGFDYPDTIAALIPSDNVLAELSLEQLPLLDDVDVIVVGDFDGTGELTSNPVYQGLDIVQQGRVVPGVEPIEGALYWASVLSLPYAIEHLTPMLAAAVDGDPTTVVSRP